MLHVNSEPNHPNEAVIKAVRDAIDGASDKPGVKQNVLRAWTILYDEQKKKNALPEVLGTQFKEHWKTDLPTAELDPDDLDTYMYQIEKYFPKLFDMIDLRRPKDSGPAAAPRARGKGPAQSWRAGGKSRNGGDRGMGRGQSRPTPEAIPLGRPARTQRSATGPGRPLGL